MKLIYAILLTMMPFTELRVGLPLAISYAIEQSIPIWLVFILILLLNILLIFFVFYFLDVIHRRLIDWRFYNKHFEKYLVRFQKKVDKFEHRREKLGFIALALFVAVPLPGTGAWSGCLVSWLLGLERKKSVLAIGIGILIAGLIILFASLGFVRFLSVL